MLSQTLASGQGSQCHLHQFGSDLLAHPSSRGCQGWLIENDKRDRRSEGEGLGWEGKKKSLVLLGMWSAKHAVLNRACQITD